MRGEEKEWRGEKGRDKETKTETEVFPDYFTDPWFD